MDITQKDRDALRQTQQTKIQPYLIGNLVEHQIQDPSKYKKLSRLEQGLDPNSQLLPPKVGYKSKYFDYGDESESNKLSEDGSQHLSSIKESDWEGEWPITVDDVQSNSWLNMDRVEFDKLEWMSDKAEKKYGDKLQSTTHFDSEGRAVPPSEIYKYLNKHMMASNKNGVNLSDLEDRIHDIESIIKYLDSQFKPQVTYALCLISKIANLATTGYYDGTFDDNVHEILLKDCLLRVRHHIDSPNETICQTALRCLRSLLCNIQIDEVFLDRLHPIINEENSETLWLRDESLSEKFDIDVDDSHCVQIDAILALVIRTDLLARLVYLIKTKQHKYVNNYNDCILDLLIRMARHSKGVCLLMGDVGLADLVIDTYLPIDVVRSNQFAQLIAIRAMKFIRILAQATKELSVKHKGSGQITIPQRIVQRLESYYHIELDGLDTTGNSTLFKIHIEAIRLMKSLLPLSEFANSIHSIVTMSPNLLMKNFQSMSSNLRSTKVVESRISLDWQFAAHTIDLVGYLMHHEIYQMKNSTIQTIWSTYVKPITLQWLNDIVRERFIPHLDVSIAIAASVIHFPNSSKSQDRQTLMNVLLENVNKMKDARENASLLYFNLLLKEAEKKSQLKDILKRDGRLRDPKMLNSYGCLDYNQSTFYDYKLNATIENDSPFILLELFTTAMHQNQTMVRDVLGLYSNNLSTIRYLRCATDYYRSPRTYESFVQGSMLAQREVLIMIRLILLQTSHYMERRREDTAHGYRDDPEPDDIRITKKESYSNLILGSISVVGLANSQIEHLVCLKDKLLETAVLNFDLHERLTRDIYRSRSTTRQFDLDYYNRFGLDVFGERALTILSHQDTYILKPLYMSVEQPGRFWIFQPLIEYYNSQIKNNTSGEKSDSRWFSRGINVPNEDNDVVACILHLHAAIIHTSTAYNHSVLRPNIEEFLCLIGLIFLDDNLFLNPRVSAALKMNLEILVAECIERRRIFTDASKVIETIDLPLYDFFNKLVDQYESCSYGDEVFTNYLLLFITAKSDKSFKKKLFSEKLETCVRQMRISLEQVWASSNLMFIQLENDPEILRLIKQAEKYVRPGSFMSVYCRKQIGVRGK